MKVLIACEFSGIVREAFKEKGHDAWSCDFLPTEIDGQHYQCDVRDILYMGWDLMVAHPPCTYLANSGVRHLHDHVLSKTGKKTKVSGSERWVALFESARFFNMLKSAPIEKIAIENPIPHKYARDLIGDYSQIIQPWMFGHWEVKATCLWLKNLPVLLPTNIVSGRTPRIHLMGPSEDRGKERSRTFIGFAKAMSEQWR